MAVRGCWPRAIFYDSKTTLFDWGWSWATASESLVKKYGSTVDAKWFAANWVRLFEAHHRRTAFAGYRPVTEIVTEALMDTFRIVDLPGTPEDVRAYTDLQKDVGLFPETESALQEQHDLGVKVWTYSDVERKYLDMYVSKFRNFTPDFVGSTEEAQFHKPNPRTYDWVLRQNGLQPRDVLYCAAPSFDVQGAMAAGLIAARLQRPTAAKSDGLLANEADGSHGIAPDYVVESLDDITTIIRANRGEA
jgi:2-haloalkanoic acid dehalogenase type II